MSQIKFTKGKIKFTKKNATIKLPLGVAKQLYEKLEGEQDVFFSVTNGILQASIQTPDCVIPSFNLKAEYFAPAKE